jgi:arabinan endo-1,5-alpha-L-arabinosidase
MRSSSFVCGVAALLGLASCSSAYSNPQPCSGDCFAHDPGLCRRASDGMYFRFNTGNEIGIWKSSSLNGPWTYQGKTLPNGSPINLAGNKDLWAPDVSPVGDTYYMYYSVSTSGSHSSAIGLATSRTMEAGTWTDHGSAIITSSTSSPYNAIDANLIQISSAKYLTLGSFWSDIYQVQLDRGGMTTTGTPYQVAYNGSGTHALEGSFVYAKSGYYYLFFSSGACCGYNTAKPAPGAEYKIVVCRSSAVNGPYVDKSGKSCTSGGGTTLLASHDNVYGPGGQGVMSDPTHGDVLYYHYANPSIGLADANYQFGWNSLSWADGWPSV